MKQVIWLLKGWKKFIQYEYKKKNLPKDCLMYNTVKLTKEQIEEIKKCTCEELQKILYNYM